MGFKKARLSASMTQQDAAKILGVNRSAIAMWETGAALPRAEMLPKIAKLYGCTIEDLFGE